MKRRRVKITGIGPVTPAGIGREEFWKGILQPISRVRPYDRLGEDMGPFIAATVDRFSISKYLGARTLPKGAARHTMFAVVGAALAIQDAKIPVEELASSKCAVVTGSSIMDFGGTLSSIDAVRERGVRRAMPRVIYSIGIGSVPSAINEVMGLSGRTLALSNQCSSGLDAIAHAASMVESGSADFAICGGTEAPLQRFPLIELRAAELTPATVDMAVRQARPFDLWRTTGVVAEGCCMFLLEPEDSPRPGYSYVSGYGFASDGSMGLCSGMVEASRVALAEARIGCDDIEVINAWGPGHKLVDKGEADSMIRLFDKRLDEIITGSIKGAIGTPLGAAPAIQVAAAALAQRHSIVPPTVNWEYPDPSCPLALAKIPIRIPHHYSLVNSHGLGAVNSSLVIERC